MRIRRGSCARPPSFLLGLGLPAGLAAREFRVLTYGAISVPILAFERSVFRPASPPAYSTHGLYNGPCPSLIRGSTSIVCRRLSNPSAIAAPPTM